MRWRAYGSNGETAEELFEQLRRLCHEERLATLLVTHNEQCDRRLRLVEGRLETMARSV